MGTNNRSNEKWIGLTILGVGVLILLRNLNLPIPTVFFSWPMILIAIGLVVALKDNFKGNSWIILMGLGAFFLFIKTHPEWNLRIFIAPAILIAIGLSFLFRRKGGFIIDKRKDSITTETIPYTTDSSTSGTTAVEDEDKIDVAAVFGAVKRNVYSKNFKGGESVAVFGGSEINLAHADFNGTVKLEVVNVFGGTTLFVPAHWQIRSEVVAIFGAIEDKRQRPAGVSTDKILVIEGFVMFGGIDIKSI
ncbi:LiaF transmembrane domain-containing protein [Lacibacter sp. H407]|uniref:LiaF transmembrane domain-containing protein n=1 Tax=Lacibacter sp. H407 TaxID=3133423 RepID=UPI0030C36834